MYARAGDVTRRTAADTAAAAELRRQRLPNRSASVSGPVPGQQNRRSDETEPGAGHPRTPRVLISVIEMMAWPSEGPSSLGPNRVGSEPTFRGRRPEASLLPPSGLHGRVCACKALDQFGRVAFRLRCCGVSVRAALCNARYVAVGTVRVKLRPPPDELLSAGGRVSGPGTRVRHSATSFSRAATTWRSDARSPRAWWKTQRALDFLHGPPRPRSPTQQRRGGWPRWGGSRAAQVAVVRLGYITK